MNSPRSSRACRSWRWSGARAAASRRWCAPALLPRLHDEGALAHPGHAARRALGRSVPQSRGLPARRRARHRAPASPRCSTRTPSPHWRLRCATIRPCWPSTCGGLPATAPPRRDCCWWWISSRSCSPWSRTRTRTTNAACGRASSRACGRRSTRRMRAIPPRAASITLRADYLGRALGIRSLADILKDADIKLGADERGRTARRHRGAGAHAGRAVRRWTGGRTDAVGRRLAGRAAAAGVHPGRAVVEAARQGDPAARAAGGCARGGSAGGAADAACRGGVRRPEPAVRRGDVPRRADGAGLARRPVARGRGHTAGAAAQRVHRGRRGWRAAMGIAGATGEPGPAGAAGDAGCQPESMASQRRRSCTRR